MPTTDTLSLNALELYYEDRGSGAPLLLLHGFTGTSDDWRHAGRDTLTEHYRLILPDARGHGRSTNPGGQFSHALCARDTLALLEALAVTRCRAIGVSLGANTLLHLASLRPDLLEAIVLVSATPYFPAQARQLMRALPTEPPEAELPALRERHPGGDEQIRALYRVQRGFAESYDDLCFTHDRLERIRARTLIVYGDRDPLYPVDMAFELARGIPGAELWVLPGAGHVPIFGEQAPEFVRTSLRFLAG